MQDFRGIVKKKDLLRAEARETKRGGPSDRRSPCRRRAKAAKAAARAIEGRILPDHASIPQHERNLCRACQVNLNDLSGFWISEGKEVTAMEFWWWSWCRGSYEPGAYR